MGESSFPDWIFLLNGVRKLHYKLQSNNYSGMLSPILARGARRWELSHDSKFMESDKLDNLESLISSSVADPSLRHVYLEAIRELRGQLGLALSSECQSMEIMDAFVWQFIVAEGFMPLLRAHTQEAVAIFAYFCVVINKLEGNWWLQGWSGFLMARVWESLDMDHRGWVRWPIEEIGWVPPSAVVSWRTE